MHSRLSLGAENLVGHLFPPKNNCERELEEGTLQPQTVWRNIIGHILPKTCKNFGIAFWFCIGVIWAVRSRKLGCIRGGEVFFTKNESACAIQLVRKLSAYGLPNGLTSPIHTLHLTALPGGYPGEKRIIDVQRRKQRSTKLYFTFSQPVV